jgi:hypothetical protein
MRGTDFSRSVCDPSHGSLADRANRAERAAEMARGIERILHEEVEEKLEDFGFIIGPMGKGLEKFTEILRKDAGRRAAKIEKQAAELRNAAEKEAREKQEAQEMIDHTQHDPKYGGNASAEPQTGHSPKEVKDIS